MNCPICKNKMKLAYDDVSEEDWWICKNCTYAEPDGYTGENQVKKEVK